MQLASGMQVSSGKMMAMRSCQPLAVPAFRSAPVRSIADLSCAPSKVLERRAQHMACQAASARQSVYLFGLFGGGGNDDVEDDETCTVAKLQIGVFGDIRKWQKDLDRIAEAHDTEDEEGLHAVFRDCLTLLLRNLEYCSYATSGGKVYNDFDSAERKFNAVSMEERAKFKEETLVNVDGRRKTASVATKGAGDGLDNWLCITLLIATEGNLKLQKISSPSDLKQVIMTLGGIRPEDLMAFELLWTPQEQGDYYTKSELLTDFPTMATLS